MVRTHFKNVILIISIYILLIGFNTAEAKTAIAILPIEYSSEVSENDKTVLESGLFQRLMESQKYNLVERARVEKIIKEQGFQTSMYVNPEKTSELGKILAVDKLIMVKAYRNFKIAAFRVDVIDVNTAEIEVSKEVSWENTEFDFLSKSCAGIILKNYPLVGKIIAKIQDIYYLDIGSQEKVNVGSRIFVARKSVLKDENGLILSNELNRSGTLKVVKVERNRSQAVLATQSDPKINIEKGDDISPEPLPFTPPVFQLKPLLSNMEKGELILFDNMSDKKYLSANNNFGDPYDGGTFHLNATRLNTGYANTQYPPPFDALDNFILEGEVEFETPSWFNVSFRWRNDLGKDRNNGFTLGFDGAGRWSIAHWTVDWEDITPPNNSSSSLNRGAAKNTFRLVAFQSKFDIYFNDQFVGSFEDEREERGTIGFGLWAGGHARIDNVKIYKVKPLS